MHDRCMGLAKVPNWHLSSIHIYPHIMHMTAAIAAESASTVLSVQVHGPVIDVGNPTSIAAAENTLAKPAHGIIS